MKPAEEDALWDRATEESKETRVERWRIAIRAAYARGVEDERERLAQTFSGVYACCCDVPYSGGDLSASIRRGTD